jgi:hypothetical protein
MANLGLCKKCGHCLKINPSVQDDRGIKLLSSQAWCDLIGILGWDSQAPDGCPYLLEHTVTLESVSELAESDEPEDFK